MHRASPWRGSGGGRDRRGGWWGPRAAHTSQPSGKGWPLCCMLQALRDSSSGNAMQCEICRTKRRRPGHRGRVRHLSGLAVPAMPVPAWQPGCLAQCLSDQLCGWVLVLVQSQASQAGASAPRMLHPAGHSLWVWMHASRASGTHLARARCRCRHRHEAGEGGQAGQGRAGCECTW